MGACEMKTATAQCAEIEDLLGILGVDANVLRIVNPGKVKKLIQTLRRTVNDRYHG